MSWLVTARTHEELRDAVEVILADTGNAKWTEAALAQFIKDALTEISDSVPYKVKDTSKTFASATRELDVSDIKDIIRIVKAEWIVSQEPPNYRRIIWIDNHTIKLDVESLPDSGASVYLYIDKRHHLDPIWVASTAYVVGDIVSPTKANRTGYRYECTTAGTSDSSEPTWGTTVSGETSDNDVTWTCRGEVPNTLKDGNLDLEDIFIDLVVGMALLNRAPYHTNKINVGSSRAMEQYASLGNQRLALARDKLRRMRKPQIKQWYPTA